MLSKEFKSAFSDNLNSAIEKFVKDNDISDSDSLDIYSIAILAQTEFASNL